MDPLPRTDAPHAGMPPLDDSAAAISSFEFANPRLFYTPIAAYIAWLSLRHLGASLPTNVNPHLPLSGLIGESKTEVMSTVPDHMRHWLSPYVTITRDGDMAATLARAEQAMNAAGITYPCVAKPDMGMRGAGVQKIDSAEALKAYIAAFPEGGHFLVQALVDEEGEAGVFYVRYPGEAQGRIISLTLKYFPRVTGDGHRTLRDLIMADTRAGALPHLYLDRFRDRLDTVVPKGEKIRLAFAGNHCRGTIFRNGADHVTQAMTDRFDDIAKAMPDFHFGRFDVRFGDFEAFRAGHGFRILEINGAGGEATHIWDSRTTLWQAYRTLADQFRHLYRIGAANRRRGFRPSGLLALFRAWRHEQNLSKRYPQTH
ncbi:D-alanine--D-alanine ligase [Yunchengibacter salinarum]|uniref:D-alanine--D-alanine ligase n=1 Tax=Yunchengibacter salinarum TaxID=3133399 RepID=UPI0035B5C80D